MHKIGKSTDIMQSFFYPEPLILWLLKPTLRRTSALVTEWSQDCGHLDTLSY